MKGTIFTLTLFLACESWSTDAVDSQSSFNLGSEVNLTCINRTWSEMVFVIWDITSEDNVCKIAVIGGGQLQDNCNDGKSLRNTSSAQSYLHIPKFSHRDVGLYRCETAYWGGATTLTISVNITVEPSVSAWLEWQDNRMVGVCKAVGGKPAASIEWKNAGNRSSVEKLSSSDGFFTVESRLDLSGGVNTDNLTCTVRHPYWESDKDFVPELRRGLLIPVFCLTAVFVVVFIIGFFLFNRKKLRKLSCCRPYLAPSKPPPAEDVEEVEPYASYVQRVNSIYNS